jgi:hypothetical protein
MAALYEISSEYREMFEHLSDALSNEEIENKEQLIADTLIELENKFDEKALNVAMYIAELESQADAVAKVAKAQAERAKSIAKKADSLRSYLLVQMHSMHKEKLQNTQITLQVAKNPVKVEILNDSVISDEFKKRVVEVTIDKTAIKAAINAGKTVEGATLVSTTRLNIK